MARPVVLLALMVCLLATASPAGAVNLANPARLWATVNVCNTPGQPNTVGVRASMPGSGSRSQQMFMRFGLQYRPENDGVWKELPGGGDSGWVAVGAARFVVRSAGRSFRFLPPAAGVTETLRGIVRFEWRRGRTVIHRATRTTTAGHPRSEGSDPRGYSAAFCEVK